jgi:hypothetical protein
LPIDRNRKILEEPQSWNLKRRESELDLDLYLDPWGRLDVKGDLPFFAGTEYLAVAPKVRMVLMAI